MIVYNELQIHYYAHPVLGDESRAVTIFIHVQALKHPGAHRRGLNRWKVTRDTDSNNDCSSWVSYVAKDGFA